jgi:hypothetical protein
MKKITQNAQEMLYVFIYRWLSNARLNLFKKMEVYGA